MSVCDTNILSFRLNESRCHRSLDGVNRYVIVIGWLDGIAAPTRTVLNLRPSAGNTSIILQLYCQRDLRFLSPYKNMSIVYIILTQIDYLAG